MCFGVRARVCVCRPPTSLYPSNPPPPHTAGIEAVALSAEATREQTEKAVRGDYAVVYLTPEKAEGALGLLQRMYDNVGICAFAIDECHCVSQWGHSFRASYLRLRVLRNTFPQVPIAALSATATHQVLVRASFDFLGVSLERLDNPTINARTKHTTGGRHRAARAGGPLRREDHRQPAQPLLRGTSIHPSVHPSVHPSIHPSIHSFAFPPPSHPIPSTNPPNPPNPLTPQVFEKSPAAEEADLRRALTELCPTGSSIVYVLTKKDAEALAGVVQRRLGIPAAFYHGGMTELARRDVYNRWARCVGGWVGG